tara:strand:- start:174 stop:611 length:438 start_codon:yes stop_codon:yes gene_type:complete
MTYKYELEKRISIKLYFAGLSMSTYNAGAVYQLLSPTGNLTLSESSGVLTLTAGRYMCEAFVSCDYASTTDVVKWSWQTDTGGSYSNIGLEGQAQVLGDTIGEKDAALATIDINQNTNLRLVVSSLTTSGTVTDNGGYIKIWKEE